MATEPDQTKWLGIRPTPDCNNIPVASEKQAPAIGDLQAIKDRYVDRTVQNNKDCSVAWTYDGDTVPAGEIWVITTATIRNQTSLSDLYFRLTVDGNISRICAWYSVAIDQFVNWNGLCVLRNPDSISFQCMLGGALDTIQLAVLGYKVGVY